ncbi:DUF4416 family protein [candidate division KSB1 bacterium]|nr:DUF4416 family protein [candidate division KSB1 bacterium]
MKPAEPIPVKLFCGVLYSDTNLLQEAQAILLEKYGAIDYQSEPFEFAISEYYRPEMGWPMYRIFWSFANLINPKEIARIKIECNDTENQLAVENNRKVNIDCGYIDYDKVVLASAKYNGQKVYLDFGIYADLTLHFEKRDFHPYPWTFPDFKSGAYNKTLLKIRENYKLQLKKSER